MGQVYSTFPSKQPSEVFKNTIKGDIALLGRANFATKGRWSTANSFKHVPNTKVWIYSHGAHVSCSKAEYSNFRELCSMEVVFDKEPEEHPPPPADQEQRTSYIRIDFEQTQKYNVERRNGTLPFQHPLPPTTTLPSHHYNPHPSHPRQHSRSSTSSMTEPPKPSRLRLHTVPSSTSKGSLSGGSSVSNQTSLTESLQDHAKSPRSGNSGSTLTPTPEQHNTYQNLLLGQSGPQIPVTQPNYQNVNVGSGSVVSVTSPGIQQSNYQNITCSAGNGPMVVHGDPMAHYADLDLTGNRTSTPREPRQTSYMQLEFNQSAVANGNSSTASPSAVVPRD